MKLRQRTLPILTLDLVPFLIQEKARLPAGSDPAILNRGRMKKTDSSDPSHSTALA